MYFYFSLSGLILATVCMLNHVICGNICDVDSDVSSQAYLAKAVFQGRVTNKTKLVPARIYGRHRYNVTVFVENVFKTGNILNVSASAKTSLVVGIFGPVNGSQCVLEAKNGSSYIFFLQTRHSWSTYDIASAPVHDSESARKAVRKIVCDKCAVAPTAKLKKRRVTSREGKRLRLTCKTSGHPAPYVTWYRDGTSLANATSPYHIRIKAVRKGSQLSIGKVTRSDSGLYKCEARSVLGVAYADGMVTVAKGEASRAPEHSVPCEEQTFCLNGGTCYLIPSLNTQFCACIQGFIGARCLEKTQESTPIVDQVRQAESIFHDYVPFLVIGIILAVVAVICLIALVVSRTVQQRDAKAKERRQEAEAREGRYRSYNGGLAPGTDAMPQTPDVMPLMRVQSVHGAPAPAPGVPGVDRFNFSPHHHYYPVDPRTTEVRNATNAWQAGTSVTSRSPPRNNVPSFYDLGRPAPPNITHSTPVSRQPSTSRGQQQQQPVAVIEKRNSFRTRLAAESVTPETPRQHLVRAKPQTTFNPRSTSVHRPPLLSTISGRSASDSDLQMTPAGLSPLVSPLTNASFSPPILRRHQDQDRENENDFLPSPTPDPESPFGYERDHPADFSRFADDSVIDRSSRREGASVLPLITSSRTSAAADFGALYAKPSRFKLFGEGFGGTDRQNGGVNLASSAELNNNNIIMPLGDSDSGPETTV